MPDGGILIITADVDVKLVNRLLLTARHYPYTEDFSDFFSILRTINPGQPLEARDGTTPLAIDQPPLHSFPANEWAGLSVDEVEKLMLAKDDNDGEASLFFVLDDQGARNKTLVVFHRAHADDMEDDEDNEDSEDDQDDEGNPDNQEDGHKKSGPLDEFDKVRIPWCDAHDVWVGLYEANASFHDYCDEDTDWKNHGVGGSSNRWANYMCDIDDDRDGPVLPERAADIKELEEQGLA